MQEDSPVKSKPKRTRTKKEAEPASKSTRRTVRGPAPKAPSPPREPTPPPREPTPPPREPTPEPPREPTPEPLREPTPEPPREPTPEPVEEREPTPVPVVERQPTPRDPTPEPIVEREPTPEPVERELSPESRDPTPEPVVECDPTPKRQPTPEPVREPTPNLMDLNSEPVRQPTPEVVKDDEDVFMEDEPKETLLSESEAEDEEKQPPIKVRSSWLSQALGNQVARPSTAHRTSMNDFGGLRQSTMHSKRKSEEVEEIKEKRPDKVARIDPTTASPAPYDRKAGSATSLPTATISTPAPAAKVQATTEPERNTTKVAKALEEMRAAAAAKVKAANEQKRLAASTTPAPSAGSGFFRGFGGLFGFQNDAARQKREEEDRKREEEDRKAQAAAEVALHRALETFREEEQREKEEQAVNDSIMADNDDIPPPEQNLIDIGDDFDSIPDDLGSSALGVAGTIDIDFAGSTTPPGSPPVKEATPKRKPPVPRKAANRPASAALASSSSQLFKTADRMASKVQGHKPAAAPVKSVARAAEAAKKDQAARDRREALRAQTERKKAAEKARKAEEERAAAEAEKKRAAEEAEARRVRLAAAEKLRKEREARIRIQQQREKAEREAEAEAARKAEEEKRKADEEKRKAEEATRKEEADKRKAAMQRSQLGKSGMKRIIPAPKTPGKTHSRPPSTFRTAERASVQRLGPPQRTSQAGPSRASSTLQQQRATLQAQLDKQAVEAELLEDSGDVSLPSIRSEYSDSDDEPSESDFKRPAWAESPALRHALEAQAQVNPDELFGPIKPLRMDELFKERAGKFRARTSSANWNGADRLTEAEEREYARRMGFKPVNAPR